MFGPTLYDLDDPIPKLKTKELQEVINAKFGRCLFEAMKSYHDYSGVIASWGIAPHEPSRLGGQCVFTGHRSSTSYVF